MNYDLDFEVKIESLPKGDIRTIGDEESNSNLVLRSSKNEQLLYLDGACDGKAPLYLGIVKSRGNQFNKLPVERNDFLGGLQIYARTTPGNSLGYSAEETPLVAGIQFKVSEEVVTGLPTEMLLALSDETGMSVKLKVDKDGNLKTTGYISLGDLTITDKEVLSDNKIERFVKVIYNNQEYAMPLYSIL